MNEINKQLLANQNNKAIIRKGFDPVENQNFFQYKFDLGDKKYMYFKYYIKSNVVSQIFTEDLECLGMYRIQIISELINNNFKRVDSRKFSINY